jgi:hypothetical protein
LNHSAGIEKMAGPPGREGLLISGSKPSGSLGRWGATLVGAIKRMILGKSSQAYMKQFGRSSAGAIGVAAALPGTPRERPRKPEFEPVHGWTRPQCADFLARNPGYRSTYEAALQEHGKGAPSMGKGPSLELVPTLVTSKEKEP